jgi:hypothetical protein
MKWSACRRSSFAATQVDPGLHRLFRPHRPGQRPHRFDPGHQRHRQQDEPEVPAVQASAQAIRRTDRANRLSKPMVPPRKKMLIFNNSPSEYFAIPIELVAFIERINTGPSDGRQNEFCQLKAETLSIVRLEDFPAGTPLKRTAATNVLDPPGSRRASHRRPDRTGSSVASMSPRPSKRGWMTAKRHHRYVLLQ